jgi:GT2 family glycosyltransferase
MPFLRSKVHISMTEIFSQTAVVVLNWNRAADTIDCIKSIDRLTDPIGKIIVVDNGSDDDSVKQIRGSHHDVEVLEVGFNGGFAKGNNIGIRRALELGMVYIWVLNNDTLVEPNALRAMLETALSDSKIGAVGSVLKYNDTIGSIQAWGGGRVNLISGISRHVKTERSIDYLIAASILLKSAAINEVGTFNEKYFMYWEDVDFSFRLKKYGWRLAVAGESIVIHKESASLGKKSAILDLYFHQSALLFFREHANFPVLPILIGFGSRCFKRLFFGDFIRARVIVEVLLGRRSTS